MPTPNLTTFAPMLSRLLQGEWNIETTPIRAALVTNAGDFDGTAEFRQDAIASGLTTVGTPMLLTNVVVLNGRVSADNVVFPTVIGADVVGVLVYIDEGSAATDVLMAWHGRRADSANINILPNGLDIIVEWNPLGIMSI